MEFYRADEVFCSGTMGELAPVKEMDGRFIPQPVPGLFTQRLATLFGELVRDESETV